MMRRSVIAAILALPAFLGAAPPKLTPEKIQRIEQAISSEMARSSIPGINVAIGTGSDQIWSNGYGTADLENLVPMTSRTAIRLGSIAKPITAVAVMQLVEQGKVQLDAPIQRYVPQFPEKQWPVTVRQLLGHLGGIRHYQGDEISSTRHYRDLVAPLEIFAKDPLLHEPGTKYSYTTYGFNLLGAAVELLTGKPFVDNLRSNIFEPAGMREIRDDDVYAIIPHRSRGYALRGDGQLVNCGLADISNKIPGGGLIGPASDLVQFAFAFNDGKLVKSGTMEKMLTSQATADGKPTGYGMGWGVGTSKGRRFAAHGGGQQGTTTFLLLFPQERTAIALMLNREGAPAVQISDRIVDILFEP